MPEKKPLINLHIEPELIEQIDDFRFQHRFESRAAAMRWLLAWALKQKPNPSDDPDLHSDS